MYLWKYIRSSDPFRCTETVILKYLQYLVFLNKSYLVVKTHKAMLLQTLPLFGNQWCKDCPLVTRFMKCLFLNKSPKRRYLVTWDVSVVLRYLKSLTPLLQLSLKLLTFKVVALIAFATAPRAQTLTAMSLDNMLTERSHVVFCFTEFLKASRQGHDFSLVIEHFADEDLCAMHTLLFYIERTESLRLSCKMFFFHFRLTNVYVAVL